MSTPITFESSTICQQIFDPNHRTERTAGGRPSGGTYESNPRVEVVLSKPATIQ